MKEELGYICPQTKKQCDDECCVSAEDCHAEAINSIISNCEPEQLNQNKMTAVEWFLTEFKKQVWFEPNSELDIWIKYLIPKAKLMEKEQILKACNEWFTEGCRYATGFEQTVWQDEEDYYNETLKSE